MCEFTVPESSNGRSAHQRRGEPVCDDCRAAQNAYQLIRRTTQEGRANARFHNVWVKYRLRRHEFEAILKRQGGACAICAKPLTSSRDTHIDHDHSCSHPGRGSSSCADCVRGILCMRCNSGIGILDDMERLKKALNYLGREDVAAVIRESRLW